VEKKPAQPAKDKKKKVLTAAEQQWEEKQRKEQERKKKQQEANESKPKWTDEELKHLTQEAEIRAAVTAIRQKILIGLEVFCFTVSSCESSFPPPIL
jgi:hypothetical protein